MSFDMNPEDDYPHGECRHEIHRLIQENAAIRELMNTYNLGGWTDAIGPMKRALEAEAKLQAVREYCQRWALPGVDVGKHGACNRVLELLNDAAPDKCQCGEPIIQDSCPRCGTWHDLAGRR